MNFMKTYKIFGIHINNTKDEYAIAFRFVKYGIKKFFSQEDQNWIKKHIFLTESEVSIDDKNIYKKIIKNYEKWFSKHGTSAEIDLNSIDLLDNAFFYFRVKNNSDDDIINFHNFFLGSKLCPQRCCLGIIANENAMHFKISDYLFFEVYFSEKNNYIKIVRKNSSYSGNRNYQFELINDTPLNVFLLNEYSNGYLPKSIHKKGVNSSGTFFPQMKIDRELYFILSQNSEYFCQMIQNYEERENYGQYSNDMLFNIALLNNIYIPVQPQEIEKNLNKSFIITRAKIIESILILYCIRCIKLIKSDVSSNGCKNLSIKLNKFLTNEKSNSTILSICFFLSYLSRLEKEDKKSVSWIDILTDAQDYASGTLQLIENVVKHVPDEEGIFCFRLHKCVNNDVKYANARLKKRYSIIDEKSSGYYIEILVSDFNQKFDIPSKFIDYIQKNLTMSEYKREYYISEDLLKSISEFNLKDLFDYQNNQNTERVWRNFYSHPQNLIAHYGLLVFEHLVKFAKGSFHVFSSNNFIVNKNQYYQSEILTDKEFFTHIPGTQYEILLPIGVSQTPLETGLVQEVDGGFTTPTSQIILIDEDNYKCLLSKHFETLNSRYFTLRPYWKSNTANEISKKIINSICEEIKENSPEKNIFTFNVSQITNMTASEVFVKAFIKVIFNKKTYSVKRFAFIDASEAFLTTFIRFFSIIYMKSGQSIQMDKRLIYLSSSSLSDEVYFSGSSINNSYAITKRAVFDETGKVTHGLQVLRREAEKSGESGHHSMESYQNIQRMIRPFFKQRVLKVLNSDIQREEFGCCMHDTHMRIGSKIHISGNYYEASLLFGFSGYVSHFALYVAENIVKQINLKQDKDYKKLVIISYETYSESLAITIRKNLKNMIKTNLKIDYVIYNESIPDNKFYRWNLVKPDKKTKFVIVVPVGSTLTTHDKIVADLLRTNFSEKDSKNPCINSILAHYVLVLVRDSMEKRKDKTDRSNIEKIFWENITSDDCSDTNKSIIIKYNRSMSDIGANNEIHCYIDVESVWHLPNNCPYCFPKQDNLILEKPLILSNRSSVVPMIKIGKTSQFNDIEAETITELLETSIVKDIKNMMPLYDALCYGHVVRDGDNHFEYYFQTEKIMESIMKNKNNILEKKLQSWRNELNEQSLSNIIYFDYVVAPIHNTNANFVNFVSQNLHTKQIIWIDTKKDFRDNIIAKYSSLNSLYINCCNQSNMVEIRFHYVDDTINSGDSFFRTKSLISSIFSKTENYNRNVKVTVFHSVFLLLNRCSLNTQKNYVIDPYHNFHSVYDLNISYMRSYSDACVPCKNEFNFSQTIPACSATSSIAMLSLKKSQRFHQRKAERINIPADMIPIGDIENSTHMSEDLDKFRNRYYYRMIVTHRLNNMLQKMENSMNNTEIVEKYLWLQMEEIFLIDNIDLSIDLFISVLKSISRPFLSFRKSVSEAAMKVIITISEYVLFKNDSNILKYCKSVTYFNNILVNMNNKILFVKVLFSCIANLRSTFLLRSRTIKEVLILCDELNKSGICPDEFIKSYIFYVKSMLCLSEKNSLSYWIENMIKENQLDEYISNDNSCTDVIKFDSYIYGKDIRNMLKIENITLIQDALYQCYKQWERKHFEDNEKDIVISETLGHYYCKAYCEFTGIDKKINLEKFDYHCKKTFSPMLSMYHHLSEIIDIPKDGNMETEYYIRLLKLTAEILGTEDAELYTKIPPNSIHNNLKNGGIFLLFSTSPILQTTSKKSDLVKFLEKITTNNIPPSYVSVGKTIYWEKIKTDNCIGAIKIVNTYSLSKKTQDYEYFIVFKWNNSINDMEIISKSRNLLSMRNLLMKRIVTDFENHIRNEFIMLRDKVNDLSTDRSGSHSPFDELKDIFLETNEVIQNAHDCQEKNGMYARYLKLIADSVISKLYVHSIAHTFPKNFHPENYKIYNMDNSDLIPLKQYQKMFALIRNSGKVVTDKGATKISSQDSKFDERMNSCSFLSPNNCGYIWCCAFIALYYNALNHGYAKKNNRGENEVTVNVICDGDFIYFRNRTKDNITDADKPVRQSNQVTIEALKYYFDNYYGKNLFKNFIDSTNNVKYYTVKIPLGHGLVDEEEKND